MWTIVSDPALFHQSGAYTATLGDLACREQIARFERTSSACRASAPSTSPSASAARSSPSDLFRTLVDPGDTVMLLDPTYANYEGQLAFVAPGIRVVRLPVLDPATWSYRPDDRPRGRRPRLHAALRPAPAEARALRRARQPDQPGGAAGAGRADARAHGRRRRVAGHRLRLQVPVLRDAAGLLRWSPADHPHLIGIHSNSKWARGLGRRLGWIEAATPVIDALERVQQCSILCPDTLSQMAMARYLAQRHRRRLAAPLRGRRQSPLPRSGAGHARGHRRPHRPAAARRRPAASTR